MFYPAPQPIARPARTPLTPSKEDPPKPPPDKRCPSEMLQQALRRGPPYPMVLTRPDDEYWVDGTEHDTPLDARGEPVLPAHSWKPKIECDETAKCYRRHFLGKSAECLEHLNIRLVRLSGTARRGTGWVVSARRSIDPRALESPACLHNTPVSRAVAHR
ncbi:Rap1 GTPase-activating protein 1 [Amphibalanus amphitrite]|uniref:Rap1 GTPase-activating protein 1 n=1 Tax=Amphibalanus amphitrite TaxID=1232801 RepID=A0A6A4WK71_AMPAM|nr:Rap1 GTPase-activating protein 1 [Amphibalanus amphitrite]